MPRLLLACLLVLLALPVGAAVTSRPYALPSGGGFPHDVAVSADGVVWYTAQRDGKLGRLDPASGRVQLVALGPGAAPPGVIIGPDGAPWGTPRGAVSRPAPPAPSSRRRRTRARGACGPTARAASGSASGTPATSASMTPRPGRGRRGTCPATARAHTPCTSTSTTWCGSASGAATPWSASSRPPRNSRCSPATSAAPTSARSSAARARSGRRSRATTASWWTAPNEASDEAQHGAPAPDSAAALVPAGRPGDRPRAPGHRRQGARRRRSQVVRDDGRRRPLRVRPGSGAGRRVATVQREEPPALRHLPHGVAARS